VTVQVKVCGITRPEDALVAVRYGVHAIGLLFWSGSKRAVSLEQARAICEVIPPFVAVVGLFVDPKEEEVASALSAVPINLLQMHGSESPAFSSGHLGREECSVWESLIVVIRRVQVHLDWDHGP
jgi:phosphoribosylanthranilate isomerase